MWERKSYGNLEESQTGASSTILGYSICFFFGAPVVEDTHEFTKHSTQPPRAQDLIRLLRECTLHVKVNAILPFLNARTLAGRGDMNQLLIDRWDLMRAKSKP